MFRFYIHLDPVFLGLLRAIDSKLDHITERLTHMATDAQVAKLTADVQKLIDAITAFQAFVADAIAKAQGQSNDPAIDALDASISAETDKLTAAVTPATPPA